MGTLLFLDVDRPLSRYAVAIPERVMRQLLIRVSSRFLHGQVVAWLSAPPFALATIARVDVLVSWNFRHIVNLGRIRLFNAVNLEQGYGTLEIRSPSEVRDYE